MLQKCKISGKEFEISQRDQEYYEKLGVPMPTLCPQERWRRRLSFRNERNLYSRKCDLSGAQILSMYHSGQPFPVYEKSLWLSDKWEAMDYAQDIDWNRPFFEQFSELMKKVPRSNLAIFDNTENSEYCNYVGDTKNCYLCFGSIFIEDCMYGNPYYSKNCLDCFLVRKSELAYECIDCEGLYSCAYLQDSYECSECYFGYDLKGCKNCIGCVGLRQKQYHIFNKAYARVDYEKFVKDFSFCDKAKVNLIEEKMAELKRAYSHLAAVMLNSENCSGNYIFDSKGCHECFQISGNEDSSYNIQTTTSKDCYDMNYTEENELCYEYMGNYRNYKALFSMICYGCSELYYCDYLRNCKHCFGCCGLRNKEYCIFNKQYSKEEYEELMPRLIEMMKKNAEWGEFFPMAVSPFAYNESVAYDYLPLRKEEALARGYKWREEDKSEFGESGFVPAEDIKDVGDEILDKVLVCELSGRKYKIMPAELKFYRKMALAIPRRHFIERHQARLKKRLAYELWARSCSKCGTEIKSPYRTDSGSSVLCEKCYLELRY